MEDYMYKNEFTYLSKKTAIVVASLSILFALSGCFSSPIWYRHVPKSLVRFYGTGSSSLQSLEKSRKFATMRAQEAIASQIQSTLQEAALDYYQENEKASNAQTLAFIEQIARQILNVEMKYSRIEKYYTNKEGETFALVSLSKANLRKALREEERRLKLLNKQAVALQKASVSTDNGEVSSSVANDTQQILNLYLNSLTSDKDLGSSEEK